MLNMPAIFQIVRKFDVLDEDFTERDLRTSRGGDKPAKPYNVPFVESTFPASRSSNIVA